MAKAIKTESLVAKAAKKEERKRKKEKKKKEEEEHRYIKSLPRTKIK